MLDIRVIRKDPEMVKKAMEKRGEVIDIDRLLEMDAKWRELQGAGDQLRANRNLIEKDISTVKKGEPLPKERSCSFEELIVKMKHASEEIAKNEKEAKKLETAINDFLFNIPNIPHETVPVGKKEETVEIRKARGQTSGLKKAHWELGPELGLIDFERGAKVAGHRFTVLYDDAALMERALVNFMLDVQKKNGYKEVWCPYMVNTKTMTGTGQLPKFEIELYKCERDNLWLIPTGEVPLTNLHQDEILKEKDLPLKYVAYTPCFRREAGEYGKDIKGIMRQHQFDKIEIVKFTRPEDSYAELEGMVKDAEEVLKLLKLPYRVVELTTGDLTFSSAKTFDLEIWVPSQDKYREVSSCSNCEDFQARRANIRYWRRGKPEFVHTLNGSGIAVGRTMIAIFENYQQADGSIKIPEALIKYMGKKEIKPAKKERKPSKPKKSAKKE